MMSVLEHGRMGVSESSPKSSEEGSLVCLRRQNAVQLPDGTGSGGKSQGVGYVTHPQWSKMHAATKTSVWSCTCQQGMVRAFSPKIASNIYAQWQI